MLRCARVIGVGAVGFLLWTIALDAQGPRGVPRLTLPDAPQERPVVDQPTFSVNVTRVEVSVLVHDGDGKPVTGLMATDFEVFEEGMPQTLRSFIPFTHRPNQLLPPEPRLTATNETPAQATVGPPASNHFTSASRMVALVLDDLHVDVRRTQVARAAARRLVAQLDPSDLLLVTTTSSSESTGYFTRDRAHATRMIDVFTGRRLLDKTLQSKRFRGDDSESERLDHYQRLCERLRNLSLALRDVAGRRKTVVLLSEGSSYGAGMSDMEVRMPDPRATGRVNAGSGSLRLMNDVLAAAAMGNVAIYPLNPNGLDVPDAELIQVSGLQDGLSPGQYSEILMEARQSREMARDLAALTGGVSLVDTNDTLGGIDRVLQDAGAHYVLAYEPQRALRPNEYRRIEIKVKRPGVRVLARRGYRAAGTPPAPPLKVPGSLSASLRTLLSGVVPEDGLPMRVDAVPVARAGRDTTMAVIVEIDGTRVGRRTRDGMLEVEQGLLTVNESGKAANGTRRLLTPTHASPRSRPPLSSRRTSPRSARPFPSSRRSRPPPRRRSRSRSTRRRAAPATMRPTETQWAVLAASSLRTVWAVDLPPGRHQLRVAALQSGSGLGGSVYLDIVVPKPPQWPGGLLVASKFLSMMPTPFIDERLAGVTAVPPTTARAFPNGDVLAVIAPHDPATGAAQARLATADGAAVWEGAGAALDGTSAVRFEVPLANAAGVSALVVTTSHGKQRLAIEVFAPADAVVPPAALMLRAPKPFVRVAADLPVAGK